MRIALLSYEYPPETGFGGIGTYTWTQARALARLGHEVHVLCGATGPSALRAAHHDGVRVWRHALEAGGSVSTELCARLGFWWSRNRLANAIQMADGLARLLVRREFDVVEFPECGAEGLLLGDLARGRSVVRFHSPAALILPHYDVAPGDRWLCAELERRAARTATVGVSASRFLAERLRELGELPRRSSPLAVIPNGVDLTAADASSDFDLRSTLQLPPERPIVLFAGRLERRKGIEIWAEVAARLLVRRDVAMVAVGRDLFGSYAGAIRPRLEQALRRGSLHHLEALPLPQVRAAMRQADLILVPSLWENCPYVVLEAMAARTPLVASDVGGVPELVQAGVSALLVPPGDAGALVEAIERLLDDQALGERLAAAGRRRVEAEFNDESVALRTLAIYRQVAA